MARGTVITTNHISTLSDTQPIDTIVNQDVAILDFKVVPGLFGDVAVFTVRLASGETLKIRTGSEVLLRQLLDFENQKLEKPWVCRIVKQKRYYTVVPPENASAFGL